jgi:hypothetical protein
MTNELENACYYIEKARMELYKAVRQHNKEAIKQGNTTDYINLPPDDWKAEYDGEMITVYIPDYVPRTAKRVPGSYERWVENMQAALWSLEKCPKYDKVFVYIKIFYPRNWDVDNRDIKPIIDGIVVANVIPDDTYNHLAYTVEGFHDENPHTIVHIFSYESMAKMLPKICK